MSKVRKIDDYRWEIPREGKMRVSGIIYADEEMITAIRDDNTLKQVENVACLPGIVKYSLAMPDAHYGYGFPIGGVAASEGKDGFISPGGVGYDINCGVRFVTSNLHRSVLNNEKLEKLTRALFNAVPCGVGSSGKIKLSPSDLKKVLEKGAKWAVEQGYGKAEDLLFTEEGGCMNTADAEVVSRKALDRGKDQLGTLGSGNHFLEIDVIDEIYENEIADAFGLTKDYIMIGIHSGSRGLGHQVCDDYLRTLRQLCSKTGFDLPDKQLVFAALSSQEGQDYFSAMSGAANFAWANRQCIMHWTEETLAKVLQMPPKELKLKLLYDVCHNIAKIEDHIVDGKKLRLCVHRKGATRAFPANHPQLPKAYLSTGQPVLIPGDMGTYSYILVGTEKAMAQTFGSTCHGAGRVWSRSEALRQTRGRDIAGELRKQGIFVIARGRETLGEEVSESYKDINQVVDVVHYAGIAKKVARLKPIAVIKG